MIHEDNIKIIQFINWEIIILILEEIIIMIHEDNIKNYTIYKLGDNYSNTRR